MSNYFKNKLKLDNNRIYHFKNEWVCDFETITDETKFFKKYKTTGLTYGYIESIEFDELNYEFNTITQLFKFFMYKKSDQIVYFHNLSFDGVFILDWLGKQHFKMSLDESIGGEHKTFRVHRTTGSKIYLIDVTIKNKWDKLINIHFRCSYQILQKSVDALGKDIGRDKYTDQQKNNPNFHHREPQYDLKKFKKDNLDYCLYCINDVRIVKQCLKDFYLTFYEFLEKHELLKHFNQIKKCITTASLSLKLQVLMVEILGYEPLQTLYLNDYKSWSIMNKFTNGGLTTYNFDYLEKEKEGKGVIIDLKSAYPAIMYGKVPVGQMLYEKPIDCEYCEFYEIYYEHIKAKDHNIPLLKSWVVNDDHKEYDNYSLERKQYTTYLLKEEMEMIEKLHTFKGKKIINTYYFKLDQYLNDFVENMFFYKEHFKKEKQLARSHAFKIAINAAYGIHAKRLDFTSVKPRNWINTTERDYEINERIDLNAPDRHSYIPNVKCDAYEPVNFEKWGVYSHKGLANYITAMTRVKLMKGIWHFGVKNFVYSDTDSLFLIDVDEQKVKDYCGENLGSWEIEKTYDKIVVLRAKLYKVWKGGVLIKQGAAGFDASLVNFKELIEHRKVVVPFAIKTHFRVNGGLVIRSIEKSIALQDRKVRQDLKKENKDREELADHVYKTMIQFDNKN